MNVLAPALREEILQDVKNSGAFSLIIDESTDVGTQKVLGVMIRYYSHKTKTTETSFYR